MDEFKKRLDAWSRGPGRKFLFYHPFLTYSNPDNDRFIDPKGNPGKELNPDSDALFRMGEDAFNRLSGRQCSKEEFENRYAAYWEMLDETRKSIHEAYTAGRIEFVKENGDVVEMMSADDIDETQVITLSWKTYSHMKGCMDEEVRQAFREVFLFHTLREIDNALLGLQCDGREAVAAAIGAANALANSIAIESGNENLTEARRQLAYQAALAKLERDPKQKEKSFVEDCWKGWQKDPKRYSSKAAFAKDMLSKCEHLQSQKKIEDWCREWERGNGTQPAE